MVTPSVAQSRKSCPHRQIVTSARKAHTSAASQPEHELHQRYLVHVALVLALGAAALAAIVGRHHLLK